MRAFPIVKRYGYDPSGTTFSFNYELEKQINLDVNPTCFWFFDGGHTMTTIFDYKRVQHGSFEGVAMHNYPFINDSIVTDKAIRLLRDDQYCYFWHNAVFESNQFTWYLWAKRLNADESAVIFEKENELKVEFDATTDKIKVTAYNEIHGATTLTSTGTYNDTDWHQLAFGMDNGDVWLNVDGGTTQTLTINGTWANDKGNPVIMGAGPIGLDTAYFDTGVASEANLLKWYNLKDLFTPDGFARANNALVRVPCQGNTVDGILEADDSVMQVTLPNTDKFGYNPVHTDGPSTLIHDFTGSSGDYTTTTLHPGLSEAWQNNDGLTMMWVFNHSNSEFTTNDYKYSGFRITGTTANNYMVIGMIGMYGAQDFYITAESHDGGNPTRVTTKVEGTQAHVAFLVYDNALDTVTLWVDGVSIGSISVNSAFSTDDITKWGLATGVTQYGGQLNTARVVSEYHAIFNYKLSSASMISFANTLAATETTNNPAQAFINNAIADADWDVLGIGPTPNWETGDLYVGGYYNMRNHKASSATSPPAISYRSQPRNHYWMDYKFQNADTHAGTQATVHKNSAVTSNGSWTFEALVYVKTATTDVGICGSYQNSSQEYAFLRVDTNGYFELIIEQGTYTITSTVQPSAGEFYYVAFTRDQATGENILYIDGSSWNVTGSTGFLSWAIHTCVACKTPASYPVFTFNVAYDVVKTPAAIAARYALLPASISNNT